MAVVIRSHTLIASEASFLLSSIIRIFYIYNYIYNNKNMFQAVRRAVNVLNVSTCI